MFRSLHMKLMLILLLLITSLMAVVGAFLTTSVSSFYIDTFYQQMDDVFGADRREFILSLRQAAARKVRPHTLRHTFATTCLQAGCDIKTLSEFLGHANPNVTLQRYVHSNLRQMRLEIDRIFSPLFRGDPVSKRCSAAQ